MDRKFLKTLGSARAGGRKPERRRSAKKCRRHNSATSLAKTRRRYRQEAGGTSPSTLSAGTPTIWVRFRLENKKKNPPINPACAAEAAKFRRESLFCPDELDSLFSYFDTGSGPRSKFESLQRFPPESGPGLTLGVAPGLSSDSGLGGSTDGSTDFLVFGSVAEGESGPPRSGARSTSRSDASAPSSEREVSEGSSGEAELEAEPDTSDQEDARDLRPGALLYRASRNQNLPAMAEALAHGADVNAANDADGGKSPLIQAVVGVSPGPGRAEIRALMSLSSHRRL